MNYTIRKTSLITARIAFESSSSLDPTTSPEIHRYLPSAWEIVSTIPGHTLGLAPEKSCALVIHVTVNDLIAIKEKVLNAGEATWTYFRIGADFQPSVLTRVDRDLDLLGRAMLLQTVCADEPEMADSDNQLRVLFAQKHPAWLQRILDRQILAWYDHNPDQFYRFASLADAGRDLGRCVDLAPFAALARFKHLLTPAQFATCLINSPQGAVQFALDDISPSDRESFLFEYAEEALQFAPDKLSDDELGYYSKIEMYAAFRFRGRVVNNRRAIMLASSYPIHFMARSDQSLAELQEEIRDSLLAYPTEWRAADHGGFPSILRGLRKHVEMGFDDRLVSDLLTKLGPADRQELADVLAAMI